jgi:hypothetical protein
MRKFLSMAACVILCLAVCGAKGRDAFEGRWTVTVTPEEGGKPYEDTLVFAAGKFASEGCKTHGFKEAEYEADLRGGQAQTFTATAKSAKEGEAKWTGTAAVAEISGQFTWTKADGSTASYTYKGTRAEKK